MKETLVRFDCRKDPKWLERALAAVADEGYAVVESVLDGPFREATRAAMYAAQEGILREVGRERLEAANEAGVLRFMMKFHPQFYALLEIPEVLAVVDAALSKTAILHLQNGFILPSFPPDRQPDVHQNRFHMDFPRVLNGYMASINTLLAVDAFTADNGATRVVPRSHQGRMPVDQEEFARRAVSLECPAGSMVVFDSTLWHSAGKNFSGKDRLAVNQQFTPSFFKQQVDYVRGVGDGAVFRQKERTRQLLGWYTRLPTSLDEYYRPESERLYRRYQG